MANTRRVARELALKALFQVDVGKQPLAAALEGALDQLRAVVQSPITQISREGRAQLDRIVGEALASSATSHTRAARQSRTAAATEIDAAAADAASLVRDVVGAAPPGDSAWAIERFSASLDDRRANLARLAAREGLPGEMLAGLRAEAERRLRQLQESLARHLPAATEAATLLVGLLNGAYDHRDEIDARLSSLATGWSLDRQAAVDRNIMRLTGYEILYLPSVPTGAAINEAVELAKKYSTAESGRFVNGVLGALAVEAGRATNVPEREESDR